MQVLFVRVGADLTPGGGQWNGPVNVRTGAFVYVPIPEQRACRPGLATPYAFLQSTLGAMNCSLPAALSGMPMHLDPDFEHLTYGDRGKKGAQLAKALRPGDWVVFYSGLRDMESGSLVYSVIGRLVVDHVDRAVDWPAASWHQNAHTRRDLAPASDDVIVVGTPAESGRLERCLPVGEYRNRAYRVRENLLEEWGELSVNDGYLQRSAVFPSVLEPERFARWWDRQGVRLLTRNWG